RATSSPARSRSRRTSANGPRRRSLDRGSAPRHAGAGPRYREAAVTSFLCKTCGTQFPESDAPPPACPICEDERQYVPADGQQWVTYDDVRASHRAEIREEQPRLTGIGMEPGFG